MTGFPEFETLLTKAKSLPAGDVPRFLGRLEEIRATVQQGLTQPVLTPQSDCLLNVAVAAQRLGISQNNLYRNSGKYPFTRREGRKVLFSSLGIDAHIRQGKTR